MIREAPSVQEEMWEFGVVVVAVDVVDVAAVDAAGAAAVGVVVVAAAPCLMHHQSPANWNCSHLPAGDHPFPTQRTTSYEEFGVHCSQGVVTDAAAHRSCLPLPDHTDWRLASTGTIPSCDCDHSNRR